jgi:hypothetical protein
MYRLVNTLKPDYGWEEELRGEFYNKPVKSLNGYTVWIPETEYKVHDVPTNFAQETTRTGSRLYYDTNSTNLLSYSSFRAKMIVGTNITEEQFDYWDHLTNFWEQHSFHLNNDAYVSSNIYDHGRHGTSTVTYTSYKIQKEIDLMLNDDADEFEDATAFYYKNNINTFQNQFPAVNHNMSIHLLALKIKDRKKSSHADKPEIYQKSDGTYLRIETTETKYQSSYHSLASEIRFDFIKKVAGNINTEQTEQSNGNLIAGSYSRFYKKRPTNFSWVYANQNEKNFDWSIFDESIKNRPSAVYNQDITARNHWIIDMTYWKTKYKLFFRKAFVLSDVPGFHQGKIIEYPWNPNGRYIKNSKGDGYNKNFGDYPLIDYLVHSGHQASEDFNEWEYILYTVFGDLADFRSEMLFKLKDLGSIMLRYFPEGTVRTTYNYDNDAPNYDAQRDGPLVMGLGLFDWGVDGSKGFLWDPTCYGLTKNEDIKWFHLNGGINSTAPFVLISRIDFGGKFPTMENNDNYCFFNLVDHRSSTSAYQNNWDVIYHNTTNAISHYKYFINMKWLSEISGGRITKLNHTRWNFWNLDLSLRGSGYLNVGYWRYPQYGNIQIPQPNWNHSKENGLWSPLILKTFNLSTLPPTHPLKPLGVSATSRVHKPGNINHSDYEDEADASKKRSALEYLSEYMRQNDYHSCTFFYFSKTPYLHFVARDYVVRERWEGEFAPNVDQDETCTLYIKDLYFIPDVYHFEDTPDDSGYSTSFKFQYSRGSTNRFEFWWKANKKFIQNLEYSEEIRVLSFELYYFKDKNVGSMSDGYDAPFTYTLEDLHEEFSDNQRVQHKPYYVLEEPYYYDWNDNLDRIKNSQESENKIVNITGTWFIKARNKSGLGGASYPLYINPNIKISDHEWYLEDTLSLRWNHPLHLITLGGPIQYVVEYTSLGGATEVLDPIEIDNPNEITSASVSLPGEGRLLIQTYAYGIQPVERIEINYTYTWNLKNTNGLEYDYGNYATLVGGDGTNEISNEIIHTNKFPRESYTLDDVKEIADENYDDESLYIVHNEEDSSYYLHLGVGVGESRVMFVNNPTIGSEVYPDSDNNHGLKDQSGDVGKTWFFQVRQFSNKQNTNIITTGDNLYANNSRNFKKDRSLKLFLEGYVGFNLWGMVNDIDIYPGNNENGYDGFRFTEIDTWWWFALIYEPEAYRTYKFKFYATKSDQFQENDIKWEATRVIESFTDFSVKFGVAEENKHTSDFKGEIRYFDYHRKALTINEINNIRGLLNDNYINPNGYKKYVYERTRQSTDNKTYFIDNTNYDNTILELNISADSVLNKTKLELFRSIPLIFRYDYEKSKYYFEFIDPNPDNLVIVDLQSLRIINNNSEWIGWSLASVQSPEEPEKKQIYLPNILGQMRNFNDGYWRVVVKLFNDSEVNDNKTKIYKNGLVIPINVVSDNSIKKVRNFDYSLVLNESGDPLLIFTFEVPYLPDEEEQQQSIPGPIEFRIYKQTGVEYTLLESFWWNQNSFITNTVDHQINFKDKGIPLDDIVGTYHVGTFWSLNEDDTSFYSILSNFNQNALTIIPKLFVSFSIDKPAKLTGFKIEFPQENHGDIKLTWNKPDGIWDKPDIYYDIYIRARRDSLSVVYTLKLYRVPDAVNTLHTSDTDKYFHTIDSDRIFNYVSESESEAQSQNSDIITSHINTPYLCELLIKVVNVYIESEFSDDIIYLSQPTINQRVPTQMLDTRTNKLTNEYLFRCDLNNFNGNFMYFKDLELRVPRMDGDIDYSMFSDAYKYVDPDVEADELKERITYYMIRKNDDITVLTSDDFNSNIEREDDKYSYINLASNLIDLKRRENIEEDIALEDILFILKLDLSYIAVIEGNLVINLNAFDSLINIPSLDIQFRAEPQPIPKKYEEYEALEHPLREKTLLGGMDFDISNAGYFFTKTIETKNIKSSYSYELKDDDKTYIEPVLKIESDSAVNLEIKDADQILEIGEKIIFTNGKGLQKSLNAIIFEKQIEIEFSVPYIYIQILYSDIIRFKIVQMELPTLPISVISIDLKFDLYVHDDERQTMFDSPPLSNKTLNEPLEHPSDFIRQAYVQKIEFDDENIQYSTQNSYTVSLSFEIRIQESSREIRTVFVNNVRVVALENIPLVDSIEIENCVILNTIYSQSIYVKFKPHQKTLYGIDTHFSVGFYHLSDEVFDKNTYIYQDLSLDSTSNFFEYHYQLFNTPKYNTVNFKNSNYYTETYTETNSKLENHQFIQNVPELNLFVKNTLNMNTPFNIATELIIKAPPSPERTTEDFITLKIDGLYYFNFKVENTECSYDEFIANDKSIPENKNEIKLTSFLEFHLMKKVDDGDGDETNDVYKPQFVIYYDHTRNLPTETELGGTKYLEYSIPFGLDDLHEDFKDIITESINLQSINPLYDLATSLIVGHWKLKIINMYHTEELDCSSTSAFTHPVVPPTLPDIAIDEYGEHKITHMDDNDNDFSQYKVEFDVAVDDDLTFESVHFVTNSISQDRKSFRIHRFDPNSSIVPHQIFDDTSSIEYGEYSFTTIDNDTETVSMNVYLNTNRDYKTALAFWLGFEENNGAKIVNTEVFDLNRDLWDFSIEVGTQDIFGTPYQGFHFTATTIPEIRTTQHTLLTLSYQRYREIVFTNGNLFAMINTLSPSEDIPHEDDYREEYPFLLKNALGVYTEISFKNGNHFDLSNVTLIFPKYHYPEENLEANNDKFFFKVQYIDEIKDNEFSSPELTGVDWISKVDEDEVNIDFEYNNEYKRDSVEIGVKTIETFYYVHTIYFTINQITRIIYIDSEKYNFTITSNMSGRKGNGVDFFVKDVLGIDIEIKLSINHLTRSRSTSITKDRTFICPYSVDDNGYFTNKNINYELDCKYWIHGVVNDYEYKNDDDKTLEHFYMNIADTLYNEERKPIIFTYPSQVIEYKVINDVLVLQEMTGSKQTYFDFRLSYTYKNFNLIYRQKIPWLSAQDYWNINLSGYTNDHKFAAQNQYHSPIGNQLNARNYAQHGMYQYVYGFDMEKRPKLRIWNGKVSPINFASPPPQGRYYYFSYTYGINTGDYGSSWTISEHFLPIVYKQNQYDDTIMTRHNIHFNIRFNPIHNFPNLTKPYKIKDMHPDFYVPTFVDKIDFVNKNSRFYTKNLHASMVDYQYNPYAYAWDKWDEYRNGPMFQNIEPSNSNNLFVNGVASYEYEVSNIRSGWWFGEGTATPMPDGTIPSIIYKQNATWKPTFYRLNHNTLKEILFHNPNLFEKIKYIIEIRPERSSGYSYLYSDYVDPDNVHRPEIVGNDTDNINAEKYTFFRLEKQDRDPSQRRRYTQVREYYAPVFENTMETFFSETILNPNPSPIFSCEYLLYEEKEILTNLSNNQPDSGSINFQRVFNYDDVQFNPDDYFEEYNTPYSQRLLNLVQPYHAIYNPIVGPWTASKLLYTDFDNKIHVRSTIENGNKTENQETFRVIVYEIEYPSTESIDPVNYFDPDQNLEQYVWYNGKIGMRSPFTPEMLWGEPNDQDIGVNKLDETDLHQYQFDEVSFKATRTFYDEYDGYDDRKWYHLNTTLNTSFEYNDPTYPTYETEGGPPRNTDDSYLYYPWYVDDNEIGNGTSRTSGYEFNRDEIVIHLERKTFNGFHLDLYFDHEIWYHDRSNLRTGMNACGMEDGGNKLFMRWTDPSKDVPYQASEVVKIFEDEFPDLYLNMPNIWAPSDLSESPYVPWVVYPYIFSARRIYSFSPSPLGANIENQHIIHNFFVLCAIDAKNNKDYGTTYKYYNINKDPIDDKVIGYEFYPYNKLFEDYLILFIDYYNDSQLISHRYNNDYYINSIQQSRLSLLYNSDAKNTLGILFDYSYDASKKDLPEVKAFKNLYTNYKEELRAYRSELEGRYVNNQEFTGTLIFEDRSREKKEYTLESYPPDFSILEHDDILVSPDDKSEPARKFQSFLSLLLGPFETREEAGFIDNTRKIDPKNDPYEYDYWSWFKSTADSHLRLFSHQGNYNAPKILRGNYKRYDYYAPFDIYTNIHLNFRSLISLRSDTESLRKENALAWNDELAELDAERVLLNYWNGIKVENGELDWRLYQASNLVIAEKQIEIYENHAKLNVDTSTTYSTTDLHFGVYPGDPRHNVSYSDLLIEPFKQYFNANDEILLDPMDYIEEPLQAGPWPSTSNVLTLLNIDEADVSTNDKFSRWRNKKFSNPFVRHEFLRRINNKGYSTHENQQSINVIPRYQAHI